MKIGIFGGTFDPFTLAHYEIVNESLKLVDKLIIIPTTISYYRNGKSPLFSFKQRTEIINCFVKRFWGDGRVSCSELEKDADSFWRTADTVRELKKLYPNDELYFILGSDSFDELDTWKEYEFLVANLKFIVVDGRNGEKTKNPLPHETIEIRESGTSASIVRRNLVEKLKSDYIERGICSFYERPS